MPWGVGPFPVKFSARPDYLPCGALCLESPFLEKKRSLVNEASPCFPHVLCLARIFIRRKSLVAHPKNFGSSFLHHWTSEPVRVSKNRKAFQRSYHDLQSLTGS